MTDLTPACRTDRYDILQQRWRSLAACAAGIVPVVLPLMPSPDEIDAVADDLRVLARNVDALVEAYGAYLEANAPGIDPALFEDVLLNAIDGNALYEIAQAAQRLRDDLTEQAYYQRYNPDAVS
jgi:phosphoenolpyruvate carboxylase